MGKESSRKRLKREGKTPDWAQFELLVARIEHQVAPEGAVVRSPDKLPDVDTGELRQVDASIRFKIGTVPVLMIFECRRRGRKEDVTWIEQLAAKLRSVGADRAIAVSSSGFSAAAVAKAKSLKVELRRVRDITKDEVGKWTRTSAGLRAEYSRIKILNAIAVVEGKDPLPGPEIERAIREDGNKARVLFNEAGDRFSLDDIVGGLHAKGLPRGALGVTTTVPLVWTPDKELFAESRAGRVRVLHLDLVLSIKNEGAEPITLDLVHEYSTPDGAVRVVGEGHLKSPRLADEYVVMESWSADDPHLQAFKKTERT